MKPNQTYFIRFFLLLNSLILFSGCGLIFGTSQKVDNKNNEYSTYRFEHEKNPKWKRISTVASNQLKDQRVLAASEQEPENADIAYEYKKGAIITLNSACHPQRNSSLKELSNNLLMGLPKKEIIESKETVLDEVAAIDTKLKFASENDKPIFLRALVLRKSGCTFDFMHIANNEQLFAETSPDFENFLKGFHAP